MRDVARRGGDPKAVPLAKEAVEQFQILLDRLREGPEGELAIKDALNHAVAETIGAASPRSRRRS